MKKYLTTALAVILVGCATAGRKVDQAAVDKIQKGVSTRADVKTLIGSPDQVTRDTDGNETWMYMYIRATTKASTFIPIVGAFAGGVDTQSQHILVMFDNAGTVSKVSSSYGGTDVGTGLNSGGKASMTDVEDGKRPK